MRIRGISLSLLFLVIYLASSSSNALMHENVFFHKLGDFSMSRSKWLVSFVVDISIYERFLGKLSNDIQSASNIADQVMARRNKSEPPRRNYNDIFTSMKHEIIVIYEIHNDIKNSFRDYLLLDETKTRAKRRVLGFIGSIMNSLFGVLTEADVSSIQRNVKRLAQNQLDLSHAVQESISVLNISRLEIRENRQKINDVLSTLGRVEDTLLNMSDQLEQHIIDVETLVVISTRLNLVIEEIKNALSRSMYFYLHFQLQVQSMTTQTLSPSTVPAITLKEMLLTISAKLPKTIGLPLDPRTHLFEYYKYLKCVPIFDGNHMIITVQIPLVEYTQTYDVFRAHSLPVPLLGTTPNDKKELLAFYKLESTYLAVNTERSKYILLSDQHTLQCGNPIFKICNIKEPVRNVNVDKSCILANFNQDKRRVNRFCNVWMHYSPLPNAMYLSNDVYLIITKSPMIFHVTCKGGKPSRNRVQIHEPFGFITLHKQCQATSDKFELIGYYENQSDQVVDDPAEAMLRDYNFSDFKVWKEFKKLDLLKNNSLEVDLPDKLADLEEFPLNALIHDLEHLRSMEDMQVTGFPSWGYIIVIISIVLLGILSIGCYCKFKNSKLAMLICAAKRNKTRTNKMIKPASLYRPVGERDNVEATGNCAEEVQIMSVLLEREEAEMDEITTSNTAETMGKSVVRQKFPILDKVKRNYASP